MKMGFDTDGMTLCVVEATSREYNAIKSWGAKMTWNKDKQRLEGYADLELLTNLSTIVRLPPPVEQRRRELQAVQDAVDRERVNEHPAPLFQYPVKLPLFAHQVRGANMALLTFGWGGTEGARV